MGVGLHACFGTVASRRILTDGEGFWERVGQDESREGDEDGEGLHCGGSLEWDTTDGWMDGCSGGGGLLG